MKIKKLLISTLLAFTLALNGFVTPALADNGSYSIAPSPVVMVFVNNLKYLMPDDRYARLHTIIHSAALEAGTAGFISAQIPGGGLVIGVLQIEMVYQIAEEYGEKIQESVAIAIIESSLANLIGVTVVDGFTKWIPGVGNLVHTATASSLTETIGWSTVTYFNNRTS
jgi:uncharacterized protein (DUF697 family)